MPEDEALRLALATWPTGQTPKVHISSGRTAAEELPGGGWRFPRVVAHADLVDVLDFEGFLRGPAATAGRDFDVLVEARLKDLAVLRLREQLRERAGRAVAPLPVALPW